MVDLEDKLASVLAALPGLSVPELAKLAEAVESARLAAAEANRAAFAAKVRAMADDMGVPLRDLLSALTPKPAPRVSAVSAVGKKTVAPKFKGPNGELWTGRGRAPTWLVALEASGRKRNEFLIGD